MQKSREARQRDQQPRQDPWQKALAALAAFRKQFGHCRVPVEWPENRWLGAWVANTRWAKKRNRLTDAQVRELDRIGFLWTIDTSGVWQQRLDELKAFTERHGHCNVPGKFRENQSLANWVKNVRVEARKGKLSQKRLRSLNALGFRWSVRTRVVRRHNLESMLARLAAIKKQPDGASNRKWLQDIRRKKRTGKLDSREIVALEKAGVVWEPVPQRWQEMYSALAAYKREHGDCNLPYESAEHPRLAAWVASLRSRRGSNRLGQEKIKQLDALGFVWNRRAARWEAMYAALVEYRQTHGHCRVPSEPRTRLAVWAVVQRRAKRLGKLSEERIRRLDMLGFVWEMQANQGRGSRRETGRPRS